jgi:hypothetical protein
MYTQATLPMERIPGTQSTEDRVGPRASLEVLKNKFLALPGSEPQSSSSWYSRYTKRATQFPIFYSNVDVMT